jgi:hypothetical protein
MILAAAVASGSSSSTLNEVEPGLLGFLIVAGLGVILFFLLRNMNKQFKKLGPPPEETDAESAAGEANTTAAVTRGTQPRAITAGTAVQTGDPEQDAKAEGSAKRE